MEKITITRGLTSLKTLEKKISKAINDAEFTDVKVGTKKSELTTADAVAALQKVQDLIDYRDNLKSAIAMSNAVTEVKVGAVTMKVTEAIEKKTSIVFRVKLLEKMRRDQMYKKDEVEEINRDVESRLDKLLRTSVGDGNAAEAEAISKPFLERNSAQLFDPLNIQGKIDALDAEIDDFLENVDVCLSESNSTTFIEV